MILQTVRPNPCGKVNKLQIIIQAKNPPLKGGFLHEVPSTNTKKTKKKPSNVDDNADYASQSMRESK